MTYVWPAIALGRAGAILAGLLGEALPASSVVQLAAVLAGNPQPAGAFAASQPTASRNAQASNSDGSPLPTGGGISQVALIVLMAALLAVFAYTVRGELRTIRWPR